MLRLFAMLDIERGLYFESLRKELRLLKSQLLNTILIISGAVLIRALK